MEQIHPDANNWNEMIASLPDAHILQTYQWGELKRSIGWQPIHLVWRQQEAIVAAAQVLHRVIPIRGLAARLGVLYIPKGPLLNWENDALRHLVLRDLQSFAKQKRAIFIKIDPDVPRAVQNPNQEILTSIKIGQDVEENLRQRGWLYSQEQIQFRNTMLLDLTLDEDQLMASMKQKTRYNIRLAQRKGVVVRTGNISDLLVLFELYNETARRDGFIIRNQAYYHKAWSMLRDSINQTSGNEPTADLIIAEVDHKPVAGLVLYRFGKRAWFLFGMSGEDCREMMPNHLLQWEAIRAARRMGCQTYDMWGAPEKFDDDDPLFGVYRFKTGFSGQYTRFIGAWDYPVYKVFYSIYTQILPSILNLLRGQARKRINQFRGGE